MTLRKTIVSTLLGTALLLGAAHAQLPPEVEADRLLLIARDSMEAKEWSKARDAFEGILALGIAVPPDFHYHYARALSHDGRPAQAKERLSLYLKNADRGSETYRDALALFNTVDADAKRAEESEKKAAVAEAKKEEDRRKATARAEEQARKLKGKIAEAEAGNADAQEALGTWYMYGTNGTKRDYIQARKWYERAIAHDHEKALVGLAFIYVNGWGTPKDFVKARDYYVRAAKYNNIDALHGLGVIYQNGFGVRKDPVAAAQWYRKGAEAGSADSQNNLAGMYLRGEGVPLNRDEAYKLYLQSAKKGNKLARKSVESNFGGFHVWD